MGISSTPRFLESRLAFFIAIFMSFNLHEHLVLAFSDIPSFLLTPTTFETVTTSENPANQSSTLTESAEEGINDIPTLTFFTAKNNTEKVVQVGSTIVLHCAAENVGENTVSWIRRRDYHLLTVGSHSYSSDERYQVKFMKEKNDWQLQIRYLQVRDSGVYECQISSHPPISLFATLNVLEATSEILGEPEKYMTTGGSLRLVCVLKDNTKPPTHVFWYHNDLMINYHLTRKVSVETEGNLSILSLSEVNPGDSGNYTCAPSNARPTYILIHVLKGGETRAAIQSRGTCRTTSSSFLRIICALLYFACNCILMQHSKVYASPKEINDHHHQSHSYR